MSSNIHYEVAVTAPIRHTLTYAGPSRLPEPVPVGMRVLVPMGRRLVTGYVLEQISPVPDAPYEIKPIARLLDPEPLLPENLISFCRWVAEYYHHPIGDVLRTALPAGLTTRSTLEIILTVRGREVLGGSDDVDGEPAWLSEILTHGRLSDKSVRSFGKNTGFNRVLRQWEEEGLVIRRPGIRQEGGRGRRETVVIGIGVPDEKPEEKVLSRWRNALIKEYPDLKKSELRTLDLYLSCCLRLGCRTVPRPEMTRIYSGAGKGVHSLVAKGIFVLEERRVYRDPFGRVPDYLPEPEYLTPEQEQVLGRLEPVLTGKTFQTFLLHGVTGCGKTEVYLQAASRVLDAGADVLVLVPEIALASQMEAQFHARFKGLLAVLHSGLSAGERFDQWQRIRRGRARVVLGARSAIFAPLRNPGLIIVDEEHEPAYKQEDKLRYHGRDLAVMRGKMADCPVVLGSATPSVTSYHHARKGKYTLLTMERRVQDQELPRVEVIDLGSVQRSRPDLFFSDPLIQALRENLENRHQSLLFVNRRGFSSFMLCQNCGQILQCRHCRVSLTMHRAAGKLVCHYCGYTLRPDVICPSCGAGKLIGLGLGSERIEQEVLQLLPHARVARLDSDTAGSGSRKRYLSILQAVHNREIDILVGTQMIAKGLHFPGMTLVGVVWADSGLGIPDFRAPERTFQLLAQVTGRAGRGELSGRVIIQTHQPAHYAIECARTHDYDGFFNQELLLRRELGYPPFARLVNIRLSGQSDARVQQAAKTIAAFLRQCSTGTDVDLLGPAPAPLAKLRDRYRWQLLLRSRHPALLHRLCRRLLEEQPGLCPATVRLGLDIDPENMM